MKQYVRPILEYEEFAANEFVAACYKIHCNVPSGIGYIERNSVPGYQKNEDQAIAEGKGCGEYHIGVNLDAPPTENAMWQPWNQNSGVPKGDPYPVFHWSTGPESTDQHFSKVEDAEWETNPNAS